MSSGYDLVCVSHEPPLWWSRDAERLEVLRTVYRHREAIWALPEDFWPDEHVGTLYWLRSHQNCMVRALHEDKSDPALSEPLDFVEPEPAATVTADGAGGVDAAAVQLGLTASETQRLSGRYFDMPDQVGPNRVKVGAGEGQSLAAQVNCGDEDRRRAVVYLGHEEILRALELSGQGYRVHHIYPDHVREAVALVVTAPHLAAVPEFEPMPELLAGAAPEYRIIDGKLWVQSRYDLIPRLTRPL